MVQYRYTSTRYSSTGYEYSYLVLFKMFLKKITMTAVFSEFDAYITSTRVPEYPGSNNCILIIMTRRYLHDVLQRIVWGNHNIIIIFIIMPAVFPTRIFTPFIVQLVLFHSTKNNIKSL